MAPFFRFFLLIYFVTALLMLGLRFAVVGRGLGYSPGIRLDTENAEGLITFYFAVLTVAGLAVVLIVSLVPQYADNLLPIALLDAFVVKVAGCVVLIASLVGVFIGQHQMRRSWRFGIQENTKTELVTSGLFRFSRNPIYVGTLAMVAGLFLVFPSAATLLILVASYMLTQIQIRLEEAYLGRHHGQVYLDYKKNVRRLI